MNENDIITIVSELNNSEYKFLIIKKKLKPNWPILAYNQSLETSTFPDK